MPDTPRITTLGEARAQIDALDVELIALLAARTRIVEQVVHIKQREGLAARLPDRVDEVIDNAVRLAKAAGVAPELVEGLWREMVEHFIALEERDLGKEGRR